ncbi:hypothetical protein DFH07DRAFT_813501 [Mycena maculata]|uniref:Uncharacterized protein n=1 Tax=Mycena maculata TaxID=230809 RepID=A0AAD7JDY0_9AGAR|nr:hypothetical protein DFH07DRAFT_813501 [Mycena maculata]
MVSSTSKEPIVTPSCSIFCTDPMDARLAIIYETSAAKIPCSTPSVLYKTPVVKVSPSPILYQTPATKAPSTVLYESSQTSILYETPAINESSSSVLYETPAIKTPRSMVLYETSPPSPAPSSYSTSGTTAAVPMHLVPDRSYRPTNRSSNIVFHGRSGPLAHPLAHRQPLATSLPYHSFSHAQLQYQGAVQYHAHAYLAGVPQGRAPRVW